MAGLDFGDCPLGAPFLSFVIMMLLTIAASDLFSGQLIFEEMSQMAGIPWSRGLSVALARTRSSPQNAAICGRLPNDKFLRSRRRHTEVFADTAFLFLAVPVGVDCLAR